MRGIIKKTLFVLFVATAPLVACTPASPLAKEVVEVVVTATSRPHTSTPEGIKLPPWGVKDTVFLAHLNPLGYTFEFDAVNGLWVDDSFWDSNAVLLTFNTDAHGNVTLVGASMNSFYAGTFGDFGMQGDVVGIFWNDVGLDRMQIGNWYVENLSKLNVVEKVEGDLGNIHIFGTFNGSEMMLIVTEG